MKELNVVLIADLHLGYNIGCKQMEQMTEKINKQKPDLVVVAGDIFDNEYEALDDPEKTGGDIERDPLKVWCVCMLRKPRYPGKDSGGIYLWQ